MQTPSAPRPRLPDLVALFVISLVLVTLQQYRLDAHTAEYSVDAASHYITGALVHDYLLTWPPASPLRYLAHYHSQYPLVGIGHWPPVFYLVEAAWMFAAGASRASMLLLSALVVAATTCLVYAAAARVAGRLLGAAMALALLLSPLVVLESMDLMLDNPVMLACLVAALAYARYLDAPSVRSGVMFGLCASAAILIKGNALCLALLPPFALLLARRPGLLRSASFWAPAVVAGLLAGLWTVATYNMVAVGFRHAWGLDYTWLALRSNTTALWDAVGPLLLPAVVGLVATTMRHAAARHSICVGAAALWLAVFVFQILVPVAIQERYMLPAVPAVLILAAVGIRLLAGYLVRTPAARVAAPVLAVAGIAALVPGALAMGQRPQLGIQPAIEAFWRIRDAANPVLLVATGADAEAAAIAEVAARDPARPSSFVVRGSRLLGGGGYNNHEYRPKFSTPEQVMQEIDRYRIPYVLLRRSANPAGEWAHVAQVEQAIAAFPLRWQVVHTDSAAATPSTLYKVVGNDTLPAEPAQLRALSGPKALAN